MTNWLAGMTITADRLNDHSVDETTTTGATAATGFTLVSFTGTRASGVATINLAVTRAGTDFHDDIPADAKGNIADTVIGTLPVGWRPSEQIYASIGDGFGDGDVAISAAGVITVRSWSNSDGSTGSASNRVPGLVAGRNLRVTSTFVTG